MLNYHRVKDASRDPSKFPRSALATRPMFRSSLGKWRSELDDEDLATVKRYAGKLLKQLGYVNDDGW